MIPQLPIQPPVSPVPAPPPGDLWPPPEHADRAARLQIMTIITRIRPPGVNVPRAWRFIEVDVNNSMTPHSMVRPTQKEKPRWSGAKAQVRRHHHTESWRGSRPGPRAVNHPAPGSACPLPRAGRPALQRARRTPGRDHRSRIAVSWTPDTTVFQMQSRTRERKPMAKPASALVE